MWTTKFVLLWRRAFVTITNVTIHEILSVRGHGDKIIDIIQRFFWIAAFTNLHRQAVDFIQVTKIIIIFWWFFFSKLLRKRGFKIHCSYSMPCISACGTWFYNSEGTITSQNFPWGYPVYPSCTYYINVYQYTQITITFNYPFGIHSGYVEVRTSSEIILETL